MIPAELVPKNEEEEKRENNTRRKKLDYKAVGPTSWARDDGPVMRVAAVPPPRQNPCT